MHAYLFVCNLSQWFVLKDKIFGGLSEADKCVRGVGRWRIPHVGQGHRRGIGIGMDRESGRCVV